MGIDQYSKTAHRRAADKISRVTAWIFRWGFADRQIISLVAGDDLRYAARLEKKGFLKRVSNAGHRDCFVLTNLGVTLAHDTLADWLEYTSASLHYPYADGRVPWSMMQHSCMCQELMIRLGCHRNINSELWCSEREFMTKKVRPDSSIIVALGDDTERIWIELERTTKPDLSRKLQIWERLKAVQEGVVTRIIWVTTGRGVEVALIRTLNSNMAVKAFRCDQSRIHLIGDVWESMAPLRDASTVVSFDEFEKETVFNPKD